MNQEEDIFEITPTPRYVRHLTAAEGYIELGMYAEANAELDEIQPRYKSLQQFLVLKLCVFAGLEKWKHVQCLAGKMALHEPDNAQWAIWSASAACRSQSVEAGKKILLEALETHPDNASIHYNLSCYETRLHDFKRAQRHLARAIQLDPRFRSVAMNDDDLAPLWMELDYK